jgi:hypothetical protein
MCAGSSDSARRFGRGERRLDTELARVQVKMAAEGFRRDERVATPFFVGPSLECVEHLGRDFDEERSLGQSPERHTRFQSDLLSCCGLNTGDPSLEVYRSQYLSRHLAEFLSV